MVLLNPMKKILIVDSVKAIVEKKKSIFSRSDFTILTAVSGEEAIKIHRAEKVDLIITDLDMPRMPGDVLCSIMRTDTKLKRVSIIIVCPNTESGFGRYESCGANAYIKKPIDLQELFQKASQLLDVPARLKMRFLVKVTVKGKFKDHSFFATSNNISVGGIFIESDKVIEKRAPITCSFFLGSDQTTSDGEIMRMVKKAHGIFQYRINFVGIDSTSKDKIEKYVDRLLSH